MTQRKLIKVYTRILREMKGSFAEIFDAMFSHTDNPLFEYCEDGKIKTLEFYEVKRSALRVAKAIQDTFSKEKGDYIALLCENPIAWTIGFWAILAAGFKPFLVNQKLPKTLNEKLLSSLPIVGSYVDSDGYSYGYPALVHAVAMNNREKIAVLEFADELALSTSGTSGQEKIVFYSGKQILNQLKNSDKIIPICKEVKSTYKGGLKLLLFLPLYHIFGLITVFFWFGFFGQTIVVLDSYSPDVILSTVKRHGVTHIFAVPLLWHGIEDKIKESVKAEGEETEKKFYEGIEKITKIGSKHPALAEFIAKRALARVRQRVFGDSPRFCISGGSYIRTSALTMMNAFGYHLHGGYGASEIGITSVELSKYYGDRNKNSVGRPLEGVEYRIEGGTLRVKSPSTCKGVLVDGVYHSSEEWFDTLDLAHVDEGGRYYIDGRKTDLVINENGENVNPDYLEQKFDFSSYPFVSDYCVLGLGEQNKEQITLLLNIEEGSNAAQMEALQGYIQSVNDSLPIGFKITCIRKADARLKDENAIKVSRSHIKKELANGSMRLYELSEEMGVEAEEGVERFVAIFADVLHLPLEEVKPSSHFLYDLGGTSLDYFSILEEVSRQTGVYLEFDPEHPLATPNDFAKAVRKEKA